MEITTVKSGNIKASVINMRWLEQWVNGEPDAVKTTTAAYAYVPLVYRAVRLRAGAVSKAEVVLTRGDDTEPIDWMYETDPQDMLWHIEANLCLAGMSCWTPVKRGAQVVDWEELNPFDIEVRTEKTAKDGTVIYFKQKSTGEQWVNAPRRNQYEMLYIPEYNPQNPLLPGQSMAAVSLGDSGLLQYLQIFASKFFEGGAMPVTLLAIDQASDAEIKRVEGFFKRSASGIKNAFKILGVRAGAIQPTMLTQPIKDLAIPELHQQARHNMAVGFEIPQTMLEDAANFATAIEHHQGFYEDTVMPRSRMITNAMTRQMFKGYIKVTQNFNKLSMFQVDEEMRARVVSSYYAVTGDKVMAFELAGVELSDDQLAKLEDKQDEKDERVDEMTANLTGDKPEEDKPEEEDPANEDMKRWKRKALKRLKDGKPAYCEFASEYIPAELSEQIKAGLQNAVTIDDVIAVFEVPKVEEGIEVKLDKLIDTLYQLTGGVNEPV